MNKSNLIGLIVVAIFIVGIFAYIDFFADTSNNGGLDSDQPSIASTTPLIIPEGTTGMMTLALNDQRKIGDTLLSVSSVVEDSRCPEGAECIQAGKVIINVRLSTPAKDWSVEMKPGDNIFTPDLIINLVDVMPAPSQKETINDDVYRFVFNIEQANTTNVSKGACYVGGCSGEVCSDDPQAVSSCIYNASYACYRNAKCERQSNGKCDWTTTSELRSCIINSNY